LQKKKGDRKALIGSPATTAVLVWGKKRGLGTETADRFLCNLLIVDHGGGRKKRKTKGREKRRGTNYLSSYLFRGFECHGGERVGKKKRLVRTALVLELLYEEKKGKNSNGKKKEEAAPFEQFILSSAGRSSHQKKRKIPQRKRRRAARHRDHDHPHMRKKKGKKDRPQEEKKKERKKQ